MTEPDLNQVRPETSATAIRALWRDLRVAHCPEDAPPVLRLLDALRETHVNGGAAFATFSIASNPILHWFISRNRLDEIEFPEHLLKLSSVVTALPDLCKDPVPDSFGFKWGSAFTLAGEIAQTLSDGGAYKRHEDGPGDAYALAEGFRTWLFGDRFDELLVLKSHKPWSAWFYDIAWDFTWLTVDKRHNKVSVLAVTDTD